MASSTSHSDSRVPWLFVKVLVWAAVAWALAAAYSIHLNPEVRFFRRSALRKQEWLAHLSGTNAPRTLICGGSGTGTSVDPERLRSVFGLRVANLGLGAGMGARLLVLYALRELQPGDSLIVAIEPDLLAGPVETPPLGVQFSLAMGWTDLRAGVGWMDTLVGLRPGGYHMFTLFGKLLLRRPLYRYSVHDLQASGWHSVPDARPFTTQEPVARPLSPDARRLLEGVRRECDRRNVRCAYSYPLTYVEAPWLDLHRATARSQARQIAEYLPVLRDPDFGGQADRSLFADTPMHPLLAGAVLRTDQLAGQISGWRLWQPGELAPASP